jgi:hypothetical protein
MDEEMIAIIVGIIMIVVLIVFVAVAWIRHRRRDCDGAGLERGNPVRTSVEGVSRP